MHFVVFDCLVIKCILHRRELNTFMAVKLPKQKLRNSSELVFSWGDFGYVRIYITIYYFFYKFWYVFMRRFL